MNERYGSAERGPFYLLHRARRWNPQERKWMGYERKRGKLNDLNKLLLGRGNWFDTIVGDLSRLLEIRYVITLDTDTQLPRDTAAKMVGTMAHPLNRPILDPATNAVTEGHALAAPASGHQRRFGAALLDRQNLQRPAGVRSLFGLGFRCLS